MQNTPPKISVVLPTFESIGTLEDTLESICQQDWPNIELIVLDGGSRDGTRHFLKENENRFKITKWLSEPDTGISDAFNKGVRIATGDYLYFIGSGDSLYANDVFTRMMDGIDPETDTLVAGQICRTSGSRRRVVPNPFSPEFDKQQLLYRMALPHQGLLMHRRYFEAHGVFDCSLHFSMDYELLLRAWHDFPKTVMKDIIVAEWVAGGVGADNTIDVYKEYRTIKNKHKVASAWWLHSLYLWHCVRFKAKKLILTE